MADEGLFKGAAHVAAKGGVMEDAPEIQSDGPKQFELAALDEPVGIDNPTSDTSVFAELAARMDCGNG